MTSGDRVDPRVWWQCCEADPDTTFFGTPDWCDILVDAFPAFQAKPYLFTFGGGMRVVVPAVEVHRARGRLSALHSMPFGTYGGFVGGLPPEADTQRQVLDHLRADGWGRFQTTVFPNPLGTPIESALAEGRDHVYAPDLSDGWYGYLSRLDSRTRYHIRKSERREVVVRQDDDRELFDEFVRLYMQSSRTWDPLLGLGPRFFRSLWYRLSEHTQLWTAHWRDQMVAGVLVFRFGRQVTPFLSAIRPDVRNLAPTNLIYANLIQTCCENGWTRMSFLGSGRKRSVERFKRSMGGVRRDFSYLDLRGPAYPIVRNPMTVAIRRLAGRLRNRGIDPPYTK